MNLGVETPERTAALADMAMFQHSLMNLGVETAAQFVGACAGGEVSAFSDESWGGDQRGDMSRLSYQAVSAFSDESWGGDPFHPLSRRRSSSGFSIL